MAARELVEIEDARRIVAGAARRLGSEQVGVAPSALGRTLAEDVVADEPVPAEANSAMDGYAVRSQDVGAATPQRPTGLSVIDESRAGTPATRSLAAGEAIAISTGAVLPAGADAVVRVEDTRPGEGGVAVLAPAARGENVRAPGEDVAAGAAVLAPGTVLGPAELGVLASVGRERAVCARRPRVSVLVSGDELLGPGEAMRPGAVRDTSSVTIPALARCAGADVVHRAVVRDTPHATLEALAAALAAADVLIVCGGVSVGAHDHVRPALRELGARELFWGVALKPGRPAWFGTAGDTLVFGLPGNPVSAMVTFTLLVVPALRALTGADERPLRASAVLDSDYVKPAGRAHAVRCRLTAHEDGWHAQPTGAQGSHVLTSMLGADALAIVPSAATGARAGERVEVEPLPRWLGAPA